MVLASYSSSLCIVFPELASGGGGPVSICMFRGAACVPEGVNITCVFTHVQATHPTNAKYMASTSGRVTFITPLENNEAR